MSPTRIELISENWTTAGPRSTMSVVPAAGAGPAAAAGPDVVRPSAAARPAAPPAWRMDRLLIGEICIELPLLRRGDEELRRGAAVVLFCARKAPGGTRGSTAFDGGAT